MYLCKVYASLCAFGASGLYTLFMPTVFACYAVFVVLANYCIGPVQYNKNDKYEE